MYGIPLWWSTGVFISQTCPQLSFSYYSIIVQIFLPGHWFSWRFKFMGFWPRQLWVFVLASVSSQLGGQQIVLWTHFSCRFKKNCWYVFFVQLFFFFFLAAPRHKPGIKSKLRLQPMPQLWQHQILNPLYWARDWICIPATAETL